jgi:glycosyltransferase involved in cell wall biosynthesis
LPCLIAGKLRNKKLVYDAHEYFTQVPEVIHRPGVQKIWKWVEELAVPKMDLCYTVSESLAEIFTKKYNKNFSVIKNVPHLQVNTNQTNIKKTDLFILYQGALNAGRGLAELIESMPYLPLRLLIAGEGDLSHDLRKLVKERKLEDKVEFLGYVKPAQLKELTPKAYIGYNLLENAGESYYYSLSNKFFDYIHALLPSISNVFPEYIRINQKFEVALLVDLSTQSIIAGVNKLLNDENYYNRLKENCNNARLVYNWQHEEKILVKLYNELC